LLEQDKNTTDIINKMAANEEILNRLYSGYAAAFPEETEFWNSLAAEENIHSSYLKSLAAKAGSVPLFIDERRFKIEAVQTFTRYLSSELNRLEQRIVNFVEALSITCDIEQSLIESKYFEVFKASSAEQEQVLAILREETEAHRNKAKTKLEKYRKTT